MGLQTIEAKSNDKRMAMKVLLMAHAITIDKDRVDDFSAYPPLGLAYLSAMLERAGHQVKILDCLVESFSNRQPVDNECIRIGLEDSETVRRVAQYDPDIIGITGNFTSFYMDAIRLAKLIKSNLHQSRIVMGGAHFTMDYQNAIKQSFIDFVIRGEGEYALVELVDSLSKSDRKIGLENIKGLVWKNPDGATVVNPARGPIVELDKLPFPAYHNLNMKAYLDQRDYSFAYNKSFPIAHMITSRGCMFNCIFCSTTNHFGQFRPRSPKQILDEIEFLVNEYGAREIHFHDDSMINDEQRIYDICNGIIKRKLKINWQISQGVTVWKVTPALLKLMQKSGMYRIGFPIESGSSKTLKFIRKPINLKHSLAMINECKRLGIYTHGNFIIGFPYETREEIKETANFIYNSGLDVVKLLIAQPLAGSDMFEVYMKEGLMPNEMEHSSTYSKTKYGTKYFKPDEINKMREEIIKTFVTEKRKTLMTFNGIRTLILPKISSPDKLLYFLKMVALAVKKTYRNQSAFGV